MLSWDKTTRDQTAWYAEFDNRGPGAQRNQRVRWSHQLTAAEASEYTPEKILAPVAAAWERGEE